MRSPSRCRNFIRVRAACDEKRQLFELARQRAVSVSKFGWGPRTEAAKRARPFAKFPTRKDSGDDNVLV